MRFGVLMLLAAACSDSRARPFTPRQASAPATAGTIRLQLVGDHFKSPVYLASPSNDARLFVVEQAGRIRILKNGVTLPAPFLDISDRVKSGGEQGLFSVAFHPNYARNGFFFVDYTDRRGNTHIERYKVTSNPDVADPSSAKLLLEIDQPFSNHNGGLVMFGPDRMLYVGMGDGGSGGDPHRNGQNRNTLLAKILRIDVDGDPYRIPSNNPYASGSQGKPEVWAIGMRNPWRFAFDSGLLYIADVGQNEYEEVDVESASAAGLNYGWNIMEADHCYGRGDCSHDGLVLPKVTYDHSGGACSITGGFVYRGSRIPSIVGDYFYSDYCAGWLRSFKFVNGSVTDQRTWKMDDIGHVVSFGEDSLHELYVISESGRIYRFVSA
jgi:Glucose/sorbosone dehydrogenases